MNYLKNLSYCDAGRERRPAAVDHETSWTPAGGMDPWTWMSSQNRGPSMLAVRSEDERTIKSKGPYEIKTGWQNIVKDTEFCFILFLCALYYLSYENVSSHTVRILIRLYNWEYMYFLRIHFVWVWLMLVYHPGLHGWFFLDLCNWSYRRTKA